jgi:hypothetical protein
MIVLASWVPKVDALGFGVHPPSDIISAKGMLSIAAARLIFSSDWCLTAPVGVADDTGAPRSSQAPNPARTVALHSAKQQQRPAKWIWLERSATVFSPARLAEILQRGIVQGRQRDIGNYPMAVGTTA